MLCPCMIGLIHPWHLTKLGWHWTVFLPHLGQFITRAKKKILRHKRNKPNFFRTNECRSVIGDQKWIAYRRKIKRKKMSCDFFIDKLPSNCLQGCITNLRKHTLQSVSFLPAPRNVCHVVAIKVRDSASGGVEEFHRFLIKLACRAIIIT